MNNKVNVLDLLIGRKMKIMTDMKVEVELTIKEVKRNNYSRDLEPATSKNDWYPETESWSDYTVIFDNGATKKFDDISDIEIIE